MNNEKRLRKGYWVNAVVPEYRPCTSCSRRMECAMDSGRRTLNALIKGVYDYYNHDEEKVKCELNMFREGVIKKDWWISVEECLPEIGRKCLITVKLKYEWEKHWQYHVDIGYICTEDDEWMTTNDWDEGQEVFITHWMPLPEPQRFGLEAEEELQ